MGDGQGASVMRGSSMVWRMRWGALCLSRSTERALTGQGLGARSKAWLGPTSRQFAALAFALFTTFLFDCRDVDPLFEKVGELAQIAV